ncbi:helix-turn-helix family protein [Anoxybacillus sp. B7M1]|uniref:helix-turn-helix domain-containing protein n=1 Tax=unclassified Anoxybacillus TaxID=2639704 RepID=UPI0005CCF7CF|nr:MULTISPECIES: helix-turn-helix transcriptional regulator [unclassified Anoxybacillus]ANB58542.1 helix-turn-helix family protein [Anoxybacillus sp. B2M1]ANB64016.1 helix-turn-helix family protein [Anoxybacillus sp. B7M1]
MISKRLSELRKKKKWPLQYIADQLNIAKSTYAGYESGYRQPSLEAVKELAQLFETSTDYLLGAADSPEKPDFHTIELTETAMLAHICFTIDGKPLTADDLNQMIAFIRVKREMDSTQPHHQ